MKGKSIFLFTPWFMGVLFIVFAMVMAFATFYENDFGAANARALIYSSKWFEFIMLLMVVNLIGQIINFKLYKRKKLTVLLFHSAFILIIIGAGVTRYFGFEGTIHIRENQTQNFCTSLDKYLNFSIKDAEGDTLFFDSKQLTVTPVKKSKYRKSTTIDDISYSLKLTQYLPNAEEAVVDVTNGSPIISVILSKGMMHKEKILFAQGDVKNVGGMLFGFEGDDSVDVQITLENDTFKIKSRYDIGEISMMSQKAVIYEKGTVFPFELMNIYKIKNISIVPEKFSKSGVIKPVNMSYKSRSTNKSVLIFELAYENKLKELYLWEQQGRGSKKTEFENHNHIIELDYSPKEVKLPFSLKLDDFILERYPGSSSPSSYKSNIVLIDKKNNIHMPYSIYMNHILKYKGWRFYQSSFDGDERGTILSVNKDPVGMFLTYTGYFLLFLFIILSVTNKNTALRKVTKNFFSPTTVKTIAILILLMTFSFKTNAQDMRGSKFVVPKSLADEFGNILVQDQKGRTEPLYTLSNDILRKVARKTEFEGYSSMQVFLGIYFDFQNWKDVPLIKVSNAEIRKLIGINSKYAAFSDIVDLNTNAYKIKQNLDAAYAKPAGARNKFDKEIIKVDERLNICFMIYTGEFMKIFPVKDKSMKWYAPKDAYKLVSGKEDSLYLKNIVGLFAQEVRNENNTGDYKQAKEILRSISNYQRKFAQYELPPKGKVKAEIFYFKSKIYDRLFPYYASLGFLLLIILLYGIVAQRKKQGLVIKIFTFLVFLGFIFHTTGLVIRWYVSGHAPMTNGYETMIFVSWVTVLAGFIFRKRPAFVLAATSVLGGFTLMVAHLSFMDPEITNLVPVLQSYWLTLHVSVITSSYGFLGLGAIIGMIVLILYIMVSENNKGNIKETIEELTVINYKALTIGLYLLTIGTFLGAVWANESWGRYWGWDPKETWSLITIIVYSFITHSRMISGLKGFFAFNVLSLFGFSSVLMTYFGVNYYLSGLHSYAGGDPVPVPGFVYVSVVVVVMLSIISYIKYKKEFRPTEGQ